ncbi:hypothetical protein GHK86_02915 [Acidimicrobiaceae bacterium USS-CC1]|uniref:HNH endonuclease n=1 Tax=Acidiferrimicrobium australe TaxID=2664430 RepID=A0ABW9QPE4_9ACTN|nr:hypothetical protein [Acidiferrimicrobium australe]
MRDPRPGLPWSRRRVHRRDAYAAWMASAGWQTRRRQWLDTWTATHAKEPTCAACGGPWTLRHGDLHHRSYDRLGHETDTDLIPLDRACHTRLHQILDSTPQWRRVGRPQATDAIIARLRQANQEDQ